MNVDSIIRTFKSYFTDIFNGKLFLSHDTKLWSIWFFFIYLTYYFLLLVCLYHLLNNNEQTSPQVHSRSFSVKEGGWDTSPFPFSLCWILRWYLPSSPCSLHMYQVVLELAISLPLDNGDSWDNSGFPGICLITTSNQEASPDKPLTNNRGAMICPWWPQEILTVFKWHIFPWMN